MSDRPLSVSLIHLIARPRDYDGRRVCLTGFLSLEFEGTCLYLHREDWEHGILDNGVWVEFRHGDVTHGREQDLNLRYVRVEATFRLSRTGHMGAFRNGGLCDLTRCTPWPPSGPNL